MSAGIQMPEYVCHKRVHALKIESIEWHVYLGSADEPETGFVTLTFADKAYEPLQRQPSYSARIKRGDDPGYYVVYADGFESWSPTKAFEEGYTPVSVGGTLRDGAPSATAK